MRYVGGAIPTRPTEKPLPHNRHLSLGRCQMQEVDSSGGDVVGRDSFTTNITPIRNAQITEPSTIVAKTFTPPRLRQVEGHGSGVVVQGLELTQRGAKITGSASVGLVVG